MTLDNLSPHEALGFMDIWVPPHGHLPAQQMPEPPASKVQNQANKVFINSHARALVPALGYLGEDVGLSLWLSMGGWWCLGMGWMCPQPPASDHPLFPSCSGHTYRLPVVGGPALASGAAQSPSEMLSHETFHCATLRATTSLCLDSHSCLFHHIRYTSHI